MLFQHEKMGAFALDNAWDSMVVQLGQKIVVEKSVRLQYYCSVGGPGAPGRARGKCCGCGCTFVDTNNTKGYSAHAISDLGLVLVNKSTYSPQGCLRGYEVKTALFKRT